jgi:sulfatase maturation enzyme AslB (radical SAM superfamily)
MSNCKSGSHLLGRLAERLEQGVGLRLNGISPESLERLMPLVNTVASPDRLSTLTGMLKRLATPKLIDRIVDINSRSQSCCPEESVNHRFVTRYLDVSKGSRGRAFVSNYLSSLETRRANELVSSFARIALTGTLRHSLLSRRKAKLGAPATILNEVQLALYSGCNLHCVGCYTREQRGGLQGRASRETIEYLVDQAAINGAFAVHIVGHGEPFASMEQAFELLEIVAARPHLMFTVITNGILMPDALARRIAELSNLLLFVSIDGPRELHDQRRGIGTHDKAMEAVRRLSGVSAPVGFSSTVTRLNRETVTSGDFVSDMAAAGCVLGGYSRYFPLSPEASKTLLLSREDIRRHVSAFEDLEESSPIPLMDLDEIEKHTGCRSRAGLTVYIDGLTGQVTPCIRSPFAPAACRVDRHGGGGLAQILAHPFFVHYRRETETCRPWCGENPVREFSAVEAELAAFGESAAEAARYRARWECEDDKELLSL